MKEKKGVFYTLSLSLLAFILLSLAFLFVLQSNETETRHLELSLFHKIYESGASSQEVFRTFFSQQGRFNVSYTNTSFTVVEGFPQVFTSLDKDLIDLEQHMEKDLNMQIDSSIFLETHSISLQPLNISYNHVNENTISIEKNTFIHGYNILLQFSENLTFCDSNLDEMGDLSFSLEVVSSGVDCTITSNSLNRGEIIFSTGSEEARMYVNVTKDLLFESPIPVESIITVEFDAIENPFLQVPILLVFTHPTYNFSKNNFVSL